MSSKAAVMSPCLVVQATTRSLIRSRQTSLSSSWTQVRAEISTAGPLTSKPVPDTQPKVRITDGATTVAVEQVENLEINTTQAKQFDITMDPTTNYKVRPKNSRDNTLKIRVPGGVWTQSATSVSAPGLAPLVLRPQTVGTLTVTVTAA